ncbi:MAG: tyrosine-type recombinase/integrase [Methylocella sp.]
MVAKRDFTDRFLRAIKPAETGKRVIVYDAQIPGFGIRVTDRSSEESRGAFVLVTRFPGSPNPTPRRIGDYPAMSLAKARGIAREWREDIRQGIDPKVKEADRLRQEARRRADTFASAFDAFAEDHLSTLRTGDVVKKAVRKHAYPLWAERPISEIKRADVNELIRSLRKDAPIGANRVLAYLKKFFSWAVDEELIEASPAAAIKKPSKENKRDRVLTEVEIRAIWQACGELSVFGRAFKLMLLTGQRRAEVGGMTWTEIDRKQRLWTLGRDRTKADRAHEVPLSELALAIIDGCPKLGDFVFSTGRRLAPQKGTKTKAGPISGWGKSKSRLDQLALEKVAAGAEPGAAPVIGEWHLHDLRRTCATYLAKLGADRIVISKILNHAEGGVTGVYDRHRYDHEKRRALELWSERLAAIIDPKEATNVVTLNPRGKA